MNSKLEDMSNFHRKFYIIAFLIIYIISATSISAMASAGYYPIKYGQTLVTETCVPELTKPPLILQIQGPGTKNKWVEVSRVNSWGKIKGNCGKFEYLVKIKWKINRTGAYSLSIKAPNNMADPSVWPDGVEIPDTSKSKTTTRKSITSILSRLNAASSLKWFEDPGILFTQPEVDKHIEAIYLTDGCGVWVLTDEHSTDTFFSSLVGKDYWAIKDTKSKKYIVITTGAASDSASHPCVQVAGKLFGWNLTN